MGGVAHSQHLTLAFDVRMPKERHEAFIKLARKCGFRGIGPSGLRELRAPRIWGWSGSGDEYRTHRLRRSLPWPAFALGVLASIVTEQRDLARQDAVTWEESAKRNRAAPRGHDGGSMPNFKKAFEEREGKLAALEQDRERQRVKLRRPCGMTGRLAIGAALCCLLPLTAAQVSRWRPCPL